MKALSLTQPWATLVAIGAKRYETRSWATNYRGPIAIHASKGFPAWAKELLSQEPFHSVLFAGGAQAAWLPTGCVIATAELVACWRTERFLKEPSGIASAEELAFGDFSNGRFAWEMQNVQVLSEPIPARGALGLWDWEQA